MQAQVEAKQNFRSELFSFADKDNDTMAGSSAASAVTNQHLASMSRLPAVEAHSNLQTPAQVAPQLGYLPPIQQPSYNQHISIQICRNYSQLSKLNLLHK